MLLLLVQLSEAQNMRGSANNTLSSSWKFLGTPIENPSNTLSPGKTPYLWQSTMNSDGTVIAMSILPPDNPTSTSGDVSSTGAVQVFQIDSEGEWQQLGQTLNCTYKGDKTEDCPAYFGYSLSLTQDGHTIAVGSYDLDGTGEHETWASVYFLNSSGLWQQRGSNIDAGKINGGASVAIGYYGDTVAVGSPKYGDCGKVSVYQMEGDWAPLGADIVGYSGFCGVGHSVWLNTNGDGLTVGSYENKTFRTYSCFMCKVWQQVGQDLTSELQNMVLSADGNTVAYADYNSKKQEAKIYVFDYQQQMVWKQRGNPVVTSSASGDVTLSISGNAHKVAAGFPLLGPSSNKEGIVRVFHYNSKWETLGEEIKGATAMAMLGYKTSMNEDGTLIALPVLTGMPDSNGKLQVYQFS